MMKDKVETEEDDISIHVFLVHIAKEVGLNESIILNHIHFWHKKNKNNGNNYIDGHYWQYNKIEAFVKTFPYLTKNKIYASLKRLEENGYIKTGNYNKMKYDQTKWYALTEKALRLFNLSISGNQKWSSENQNSISDFTNSISENQNTIPVSNTYSNTDNKDSICANAQPQNLFEGEIEKPKRKVFEKPTEDEVFSYMKEQEYPVQAEAAKFINYYDANGWMVGRNKMKDWKAAVRNWVMNARKFNNQPKNQSQQNLSTVPQGYKSLTRKEYKDQYNQSKYE